jgi:hypothetical protein
MEFGMHLYFRDKATVRQTDSLSRVFSAFLQRGKMSLQGPKVRGNLI